MRRADTRLAPPLLTVSALALLALTVVLGLVVTGPDVVQGDYVRLIYVHPPVAWVAYVAFTVTAICSVLYLMPRTRSLRWDRLAGASAEIGVVFAGLMLATGSIWGRPTWGVWWAWDDARLTSAAMLFLLFLGYLALRRVSLVPESRATRSAFAGILAAANIPIVHLSVEWWATQHQKASVLRPDLDFQVRGLQLWTMLLAFVAFTLTYAWLLVMRVRLARWEAAVDARGLEAALMERHAEGADRTGAPGRAGTPEAVGS